jgi:hypothetical protein
MKREETTKRRAVVRWLAKREERGRIEWPTGSCAELTVVREEPAMAAHAIGRRAGLRTEGGRRTKE